MLQNTESKSEDNQLAAQLGAAFQRGEIIASATKGSSADGSGGDGSGTDALSLIVWRDLDEKQMASVLASDNFDVFVEMDLFRALFIWAARRTGSEDQKTQIEFLQRSGMLSLIRFPLMNTTELAEVAALNVLPPDDMFALFTVTGSKGRVTTDHKLAYNSHSRRHAGKFKLWVRTVSSGGNETVYWIEIAINAEGGVHGEVRSYRDTSLTAPIDGEAKGEEFKFSEKYQESSGDWGFVKTLYNYTFPITSVEQLRTDFDTLEGTYSAPNDGFHGHVWLHSKPRQWGN